ncbi:MAG: tetratricopeptide repeat protein [Burkholderiaceae bacterium]
MAYDLQEQEQIDQLKAFWARWGTAILGAVTAALFAFAALKGWEWYQWRQSATAGAHYAQLMEAVDNKDTAAIKGRSKDLMDDFGSTAYAQMAGLVSARGLLDGGDRGGATAALKWVADRGKDPEFRLLARLRLAALQLDDKAYDAALATLASPDLAAASVDLKAAFSDRRADVLFASGKLKEARAEYDKALEQASATSGLRDPIQLKRDAIRG